MADGITEPATTILCQNSAHADAGGDGFFDAADFFAKFPLRFVDQLTVPSKTYRVLDALTNGDATNPVVPAGAVTAIRFLDCSVKFDSAKAFTTSAISPENRSLNLGEKVGVGGVWKGSNLELTGGLGLTLRGSVFMYDSRIYHATQTIGIQPGAAGQGEIIQGTLEMRGSQLANLGTATFAFGPIRGLALIHRTTNANSVMNIPDCIGLTVYPLAGSFYGLRPTGNLSVKGLTFAKGGQTTADMFPISAAVGVTDWDINDVAWSQLVPGVVAFQASGFTIWEGATSRFQVVDPSLAPVAGVALEIIDRFGATVVDVDTDSNGTVSYNSGSRATCLRFSGRITSAGVLIETDQFPWTVKVNHKRAINAAFATRQFQLSPTYTSYTGGRQFNPISEQIVLTAAAGPTADFRWTPGGGLSGVTVQFTDESLAGDAAITSRVWDFGDGASSALTNPAHSYTVPGTYSVTLQVTTSIGVSTKTVISAVFVGTPLAPFVRRSGPQTTFTPQNPSAGSFRAKDTPATAFDRQVDPTTGFTPCGATAEPTYQHTNPTAGTFTHKGIGDTQYEECGTPEVPEETIIFPGVALPLE